MRKKVLTMLLAVVLAVGLLPVTAWAAASPEASSNINAQAYEYGRWASTVKSYLYENKSGGLTRVEYIPAAYQYVYSNGSWNNVKVSEERVLVEDYSGSFVFQRSYSIPMELDIWGGFYAGETCNFLVFGQTNTEQDNNKEVIRVVKYSKDWQRLGQASLRGANTTVPFDAGSLRFAEYNGELYIRTCHEMYTSSDGRNHQANLTMAVRESDMTVLDSYYIVMNSSVGYVSHSFNQFVIVDQQQRIVTLDHGDAYPRSAVLMIYNTKAGRGKFSGSVSSTTIQSFPGATGANTTGASLGGLAETTGGYAVAYNYDGAGSSDSAAKRSVYFAYVDKSSRKVTAAKLSDAGTLPPFLAPTSLNGGYILWNSSDANGRATDTLYYAPYSDGGSVGAVKTAAASLSDCQPICYNGKAVWYVTNKSIPVFYTLDGNGVTAVEASVGSGEPTEPEKPTEPVKPVFTDVDPTEWYAAAVNWAVENKVTVGTSDTEFSPEETCTHIQILTFLWRAAGRPVSNVYAPVEVDPDVPDYRGTVNWAYEKGMITRSFSSGAPCTRADAVKYIWQAFGSKTGSPARSFSDVSPYDDYAEAVNWALANGVTAGDDPVLNTFNPTKVCDRGEIVTFLHRAYVPDVRVK